MTDRQDDGQRRSLPERILFLDGGELRQVVPFFLLYLSLFMGLTLMDGLSLALFVQQVGAERLPACYALTAVLNLLGIAAYLWGIHRFGSVTVFQGILAGSAALALLVWGVDRGFGGGEHWYALLFVGRELSFTLVLMHFGTYLLDYFGRDQLQRVLPIIYAGGRLGGIAGGGVLQAGARFLDPIDLVLLFAGLFGSGMVVLWLIRPPRSASRVVPQAPSDAAAATDDSAEDPLERDAARSLGGFLRFVWRSPMMYWTTVTSVLFVVCRWILNFQYSSRFETAFPDTAAMAEFLGRYTQVALLISLFLQLTLVNRLVCWIGLKGSHLLYGLLVLGAFTGNLLWMTFAAAVFSRFVETELRFGLRNPIAQMMLNQFSKTVRVQVRAWSLGFLIPCSTLAAAALLLRVPASTGATGVAVLGTLAGLGYVATSFGLYSSLRDSGRR